MPAVGKCQQRDFRDFADGQDWGRGAAVAALAVGIAARRLARWARL